MHAGTQPWMVGQKQETLNSVPGEVEPRLAGRVREQLSAYGGHMRGLKGRGVRYYNGEPSVGKGPEKVPGGQRIWWMAEGSFLGRVWGEVPVRRCILHSWQGAEEGMGLKCEDEGLRVELHG